MQAQAGAKVRGLAAAVVTFIAMPFLVTGLFRIMPIGGWGSTALPFLLLGAGLLAVWMLRPSWIPAPRYVVVGGVASLVVWAVFLAWLFTQISTPGFD